MDIVRNADGTLVVPVKEERRHDTDEAADTTSGAVDRESHPANAAAPTTRVLHPGEGGYDEMCFVWMYYYPSFGFDICVDGECRQNEGRPDGKGDGGLGGTEDAGIAP